MDEIKSDETKQSSGILNIDYHHGRLKRMDYKYRLRRRSDIIINIIKKYYSNFSESKLLDVGTADGLMLSKLNKIFKFNNVIGIDMSEELLKSNNDSSIKLIIGDAEKLDFPDNHFEIVVSCATIEHLNNPAKMVSECYRVLSDGGLFIVTTPNPIHDKFSEIIKYSNPDEHADHLNIDKLKSLFKSSNFKVLEAKYFMLSPFFTIPLEDQIDDFLNTIKIGKFLCCNQVIVGKK